MISFIIPVYNSENTIGKCIKSILNQDCEKEVIVVDGGSKDKTREMVKKYSVRLLVEKKRGPAAARNRGLQIAKGSYIAFIDADVILPEGWIKKAIKKLKGNTVGVGGPGISAEKNVISASLNALLYGKTQNIRRKYVSSLATMDVLYKKSAIKGQFFNELLITAEDPEFNFRILKKGYRLLYDSELWVQHSHPITLGGLIRRWYNYGKNYPIPYIKYRERRTKTFYIRVLYFPMLIVLLLASLISPIFLYLVLLQIFLLFLTYLSIGFTLVRGKILLAFPFIHTIKQLSHMFGIFICFLKRI